MADQRYPLSIQNFTPQTPEEHKANLVELERWGNTLPFDYTVGWTSLVHPIAPYVGQIIFETDTTKTMQWSGTAWLCIARISGADAYTPTCYFNTTALTLGNGTLVASYNAIGNWIDVQFTLSFGTTTNLNGGTGGFNFTTPAGFTPQHSLGTSNPYAPVGTASIIQNAIGRTSRIAVVANDLAIDRVVFMDEAWGGGVVSESAPFTANQNGNTFLALLRYRWQ